MRQHPGPDWPRGAAAPRARSKCAGRRRDPNRPIERGAGTAVSRSEIGSENGKGPVHVAAGPAGGFGGVVPSGQVQGSDGEVSEGGHGAWPGAGADGGVVFAVEGVAEPVEGLDPTPAADQGGDGFRGAPGCVQAGDAG